MVGFAVVAGGLGSLTGGSYHVSNVGRDTGGGIVVVVLCLTDIRTITWSDIVMDPVYSIFLGTIGDTPSWGFIITLVLDTDISFSYVYSTVEGFSSVREDSIGTAYRNMGGTESDSLGNILGGIVVDGGNIVGGDRTYMGSLGTTESGGRSTGVILVVFISGEDTIGTRPGNWNTGLVVGNTLGIVS